MNCDECKERVFELIEQEVTDPRMVREVLDACPECRALFEQTKAGLDVAAELPMEEPPPRVDATILRAAARRRPGEVSRRSPRSWVRATPWAMAAVALLAIGIGVWTIPRKVQLEDESPPSDLLRGVDRAARSTSEAPPAEGDALKPSDQAFAEPEQVAPEPARRRSPGGAVARSPAAQKPRPSAMRKSLEPSEANAMPSEPIADEYEATPAKTMRANETAAGIAADRPDREERAREREICNRLIRQHEFDEKADAEVELDSEHQLKLGRCYAEVGQVDTARAFLKRAAENVRTKDRAEAELRLLDRKRD